MSLGAWFIGLEVEHVDDRSMCCGTPPGTDHILFLVYLSNFVNFPSSIIKVFDDECRLWKESTSRQCLCGLIRLELQRDLQIGGKNKGSSCKVCWRCFHSLECTCLSKTEKLSLIFLFIYLYSQNWEAEKAWWKRAEIGRRGRLGGKFIGTGRVKEE